MKYAPLHDLLVLSDSGIWGEEDPENGVSVLRSTNFNSDGSLNFEKLSFRVIDSRKRDAKLLRPGDILLEKSGGGPQQPVGRVCLFQSSTIPHSFGNFIARLRPNEIVLSEYLFFYLWYFHASGQTNQYQKQTTGIRNLEFKRYLTIDVPVPPLPEQRRIIDLLTRAEGIVRLRREAAKKAAELIPALFLDMFGDPATNPNGFEVRLLKEIADIGSGVTKGRKLDGHETIELPYLAVVNVQDGHLNLDRVKSIRIKPSEIEKYRVLPGDFLMTEGGDPDKLGRGAIWSGEIETCLHQNHIFRVRCNQEVLLPEYLRSLVGSHYGKGYFLRVAKQTTGIASINKTQLGNFPVLVSPIEIQNEFVMRLENIQSILRQQEAAQDSSESSFQSLLHRVFFDGI